MEKNSIWSREYRSTLTNRRGSHALKTVLWTAVGIVSIFKIVSHAGWYGEAKAALTVMDASTPKDFLSKEFREEI